MPIVHFTTVHRRGDIRIRIKEVATLARAFSAVTLLVQDGMGDATDDGGRVVIRDVGEPGGRLLRATRGGWRMWHAIRKLRPSVAHFHDPELIPVGFLLKLSGVKVVYDVHEDVPRDIFSKDWLPRILKWPVAKLMAALEWLAGRSFDGIVTVTPTIARRFPGSKTALVQNFPLLDELHTARPLPFRQREPLALYAGIIVNIRGAREMIQALACIPRSCAVRLALAGEFVPTSLRDELSRMEGWPRVRELGWCERSKVVELMGRAQVGLLLYWPEPNHTQAQPNKLFEYMSAGLPVIASDFPLWRRIVDGAQCGILVDPLDPAAIGRAIEWIVAHPDEAEAMGQRARQAVLSQYNWEGESISLLKLYGRLLGRESSISGS